jgi:inositol-1,4,5-trisphosphate 5-phosphatase
MVTYEKYPDYHEYDIQFMPTYKRNKFEGGYFNKKNQAPSYTDRILFKNNTSINILPEKYDSLEHIYGSDHRPVMLDLNLMIKPVQYLKIADLID